jgi:hypothetical protein
MSFWLTRDAFNRGRLLCLSKQAAPKKFIGQNERYLSAFSRYNRLRRAFAGPTKNTFFILIISDSNFSARLRQKDFVNDPGIVTILLATLELMYYNNVDTVCAVKEESFQC